MSQTPIPINLDPDQAGLILYGLQLVVKRGASLGGEIWLKRSVDAESIRVALIEAANQAGYVRLGDRRKR